MTQRLTAFFLFFIFNIAVAFAQNTSILNGSVLDENGEPLYLATISVPSLNLHTLSDAQGNFSIIIPSNKTVDLLVEFKGKIAKSISVFLKPGQAQKIDLLLETELLLLDSVLISKKQKQSVDQRSEVSSYRIDPKLPKLLPSAFNDFNKLLATLPGVVSNSELSSQYGVRGGNFDENLTYVNDIEIYRPYLVKSGQQEGLSFINADLVKDIEFSSGGWQPRYGDKLSSVLAVNYKVPYRFKASGSASLLGGTLHLENVSKNERVSYVIGVRQKSSQYLLNTLPVKGEYRPRFFDLQSYISFDLTKNRKEGGAPKTTLGLLTSFARNNYFILPTQSTTNFGTFSKVLQLKVDFDGKETMQYETFQSGLKLSRIHNDKLKTDWIVSAVKSAEREYSDLEGGYSLSEIQTDPNSSEFNKPIFNLGTGSLFNHERSKLNIGIISLAHKGYYSVNKGNKIQWGFTQSQESIHDNLSEYSFIDSAGYVTVTKYLQSSARLLSYRSQAYIQQKRDIDSLHSFTYGARLNYWTLNKQLLFSPRLQYAFKPRWKRNVVFKMAAGVYQQSPFYRELRNMNGVVNKKVKAQSSIQLIGGSDWDFKMYGRDFKFTAEIYGKYLYNVIPYDVDNVRIRYYGVNNAKAYAAGADLRVSGEFIKDAESWFSLGILTTKENVEGDGRGYIRRPTDQRVTAAIFFQDNLPGNPSIKANVNFVVGSGLPFGPPNSTQYRNYYSAPLYRRVDVGFSKLITYNDRVADKKGFLESIWISLEVLNLLGVNNTISYLWITDVNNNQYAVPNTLSTRFINLRIVVNK